MSGTGAPAPGSDNGAASQPRIQIVAQYIKDLSFENPGAPNHISTRPNIELGVDLGVRQTEAGLFEIEMKLRIDAKTPEAKQVFLLELTYAGLLQIVNIPEDVMQQVLLIEGPHLLFPYVRRIISDTVRDGGMPPLMIEPIDFAALYRSRVEQMAQMRAPAPGGNA